MYYKGYEIYNSKGYVTIKRNGNFVSTADNTSEAMKDIDDLIKEQEEMLVS